MNLNEKLKDLKSFLEEIKFESNEIDIDEFLSFYYPEDPS
jgi:hypothetical protein